MGWVRSIYEHRAILRMLVIRNLQIKYSNMRLGYLWTFLEPLGMAVTLWFVFAYVLGARNIGQQPYILFLTLAILPWWWFTRTVAASTRFLRKSPALIRASTLPREFWVLRGVLSATIEFIITLPIVIIAILLTQQMPSAWIAMYPVAIIVEFILILGLALALSSACVRLPDLGKTVRIILRVMFYLSPVIYSLAVVPDRLPPAVVALASLNPMAGILSAYRVGFWFDEFSTVYAFPVATAVSVIVLFIGIWIFRRNERQVLKLV